MSQAQGQIGKAIPDLKSIEYAGNDEKPVQRRRIVQFVEPKRSESDSEVPTPPTAAAR